MSKIGRKPIDVLDTKVELKGREVHYRGAHGSGVHVIPEGLDVSLVDKHLVLVPVAGVPLRRIKAVWGLHRALLASKVSGVSKPFEKKIIIVGLGYKAALSGSTLTLSLGFSHKIELAVPKDVTIDIDKSGQRVTVRSHDKELVGSVCDMIRNCRPPEPYKGTGVKLENEVIRRKAGKAKSGGD